MVPQQPNPANQANAAGLNAPPDFNAAPIRYPSMSIAGKPPAAANPAEEAKAAP